MSSKERFVLTVKCKRCTFQVTQEVRVEPDELVATKNEMLKQAASIHKVHADLSNFEIF